MNPIMKNTLALAILLILSTTAPVLALDAYELEQSGSCEKCTLLPGIYKVLGR